MVRLDPARNPRSASAMLRSWKSVAAGSLRTLT